MHTIIVGENASGKTLYLENRIAELAKEGKNVISNLLDKDLYKYRGYNLERLDELPDVFKYLDAAVISQNAISIVDDDVAMRSELLELMMLICREGDVLILDEPEYGLSEWEAYYLLRLIGMTADTFEVIEIVTHDKVFLWLRDFTVKTIGERSGYPTLVDVKERGFEEIDK